MIIKTSTFPHGPAKYADQDTIVQRLQVVSGRLQFVDDYVGALVDNDEYFVPERAIEPSKPRTGDAILTWMEENGIDAEFYYDVDMLCESVVLSNKHGQDLVTYPYGEGCLREACEFLMDQENI